jgi:hypothetical protein
MTNCAEHVKLCCSPVEPSLYLQCWPAPERCEVRVVEQVNTLTSLQEEQQQQQRWKPSEPMSSSAMGGGVFCAKQNMIMACPAAALLCDDPCMPCAHTPAHVALDPNPGIPLVPRIFK